MSRLSRNVLALFAPFTLTTPLAAQPAGDRSATVPQGVSAGDWSSIRAAYDANRHAAFAVDGGYQARDPGQRWTTRLNRRGFETKPDSGNWSWG